MKQFLIIICLFGISCKKSSDPLKKFANNVIEIQVISSIGESSFTTFKGELAPMYITWGFGVANKFAAEGKSSPSERKFFFGVSSNDSTNTKVTCFYYPSGTDPNSYNTDNPGTITFTSFSNNFAEGSFYAKCKRQSDSIIIKGTFRGYYNN